MGMGKSGYVTDYKTYEIECEDSGLLYEAYVAVDLFVQEPFQGSAYNCDSADDYYGYTEIEAIDIDSVTVYANGGENEVEAPIPEWVIDRIHENVENDEFDTTGEY